jgi:fructokinase
MTASSDKRPVVVGIGEVLWDLLPRGKQLGGAPANFACHAGKLGAEAYVLSSVGADSLGRELLGQLAQLGLDRRFVQRDELHPTGTVSVEIDELGQPRYVIHENVAWDHIAFSPQAAELAARADVVCFGSLAQRSAVSRATIRSFLAATRKDCLRVFDVNLRQHDYNREIISTGMTTAGVLKLNDEELPTLAALFGIAGSQPQVLAELLRQYSLDLIALTRGDEGALLVTPERCSSQPGVPAEVVDTVGAGDAFTAALAMGLLRRLDLDAVNRRACQLASYVCSQPGANPDVPAEIGKSPGPANP